MTGLSNRLTLIIEGLCGVVAARGARDRAVAPLVVLIWSRLRRMAARFALVSEAGASQARPGGLPATPAVRLRLGPRQGSACPRPRLPSGFAWLVRLAPEAACYGGQVRHWLADPELAALLAATPQLGRILRPLCRMLGVQPGPELQAELRAALLRPRRGSPSSPARPAVPGRPPPDLPLRAPRSAETGAAAARSSGPPAGWPLRPPIPA